MLPAYLTFLQKNNISDYTKLRDVLLQPPYSMKVNNDSDIKRFVCTEHTIQDEVTKIIDGIIVDCKMISQPIYMDIRFGIAITSDIYTHFPLDMTVRRAHSILGRTLFKLIYYDKIWHVLSDANESSDMDHMQIFKVCCDAEGFDYKNNLIKTNIYFFYVRHRLLAPEDPLSLPNLRLFRVYDNKNFEPIRHSTNVATLDRTVIPTKYQLVRLIQSPTYMCKFLIELGENELYVVYNEKYFEFMKIHKLVFSPDLYTRYINLLKTGCKDFYVKYFTRDKIVFEKLDQILDILVGYLFTEYMSVYVDKKKADNVIMFKKNEILFAIHELYLNSGTTIRKDDVRNVFIYKMTQCDIERILRDNYILC